MVAGFILNGKLRDVCAEDIYTLLTTPVFGKDAIYDCPIAKLMEQKKFMKVALTTEASCSYIPIISHEVTDYFKKSQHFKGKSSIVNIPPQMAEIIIFTASHSLQGADIRTSSANLSLLYINKRGRKRENLFSVQDCLVKPHSLGGSHLNTSESNYLQYHQLYL